MSFFTECIPAILGMKSFYIALIIALYFGYRESEKEYNNTKEKLMNPKSPDDIPMFSVVTDEYIEKDASEKRKATVVAIPVAIMLVLLPIFMIAQDHACVGL